LTSSLLPACRVAGWLQNGSQRALSAKRRRRLKIFYNLTNEQWDLIPSCHRWTSCNSGNFRHRRFNGTILTVPFKVGKEKRPSNHLIVVLLENWCFTDGLQVCSDCMLRSVRLRYRGTTKLQCQPGCPWIFLVIKPPMTVRPLHTQQLMPVSRMPQLVLIHPCLRVP
jgi:hypothetical protein